MSGISPLALFIRAAVKLARQVEIPPVTSGMQISSILKEWRTVKIGMPRGTGKTTALTDLYQSQPSVIMARGHFTQHLRQKGVDCLDVTALAGRLIGPDEFAGTELILVDEAFAFNGMELHHVYDFAAFLIERRAADMNKLVVVLVGT